MKGIICAEPERVRALIIEHLPQLGPEATEKLVLYYKILVDWNSRMNLTAITDPDGVVLRHFADSLIGAELIPHGARCVDVGTGAGFPGIPLKIARPDIELTLLDSLRKRIIFLNEVLKELDLNCETVHARAEDAGRMDAFRERFDIAVSRAVAPVNLLAEWTLPFVNVGGASLMYKGPAAPDELKIAQNALKLLNASAEMRSFPAEWGERRIIVIKKTAHTSDKYPRKAGMAEKSPL